MFWVGIIFIFLLTIFALALYLNQGFYIKSKVNKYFKGTKYYIYKHASVKKLKPDKLNEILNYRSCIRSNFIKSTDNHSLFNCCYLTLSRYPMHMDIITTYGFFSGYNFDGMLITFPLKSTINSSYCFWNDHDPEYINLTEVRTTYKELNLAEGYSFYKENNCEETNMLNESDFLLSLSTKMTEIFSKYNAYTAILLGQWCYVLLRDTDIYRYDKNQLLSFLREMEQISTYVNNDELRWQKVTH